MEWMAAVLMIVFGSIYFFWKKEGSKKRLIFKALATFMPVLLAMFAAFQTKSSTSWLTFAGIVCYMAADVLLEIWFLAGVASFGAGHIFLISGMLQANMVSWNVIAVFILLYGFMFLVTHSYLKRLKELLFPGCLYAALLCIMASMAVGAGIGQGGFMGAAAAAGGICFVISDTILGWVQFSGKSSKKYSAVLLILYYLAVYLLAISLHG